MNTVTPNRSGVAAVILAEAPAPRKASNILVPPKYSLDLADSWKGLGDAQGLRRPHFWEPEVDNPSESTTRRKWEGILLTSGTNEGKKNYTVIFKIIKIYKCTHTYMWIYIWTNLNKGIKPESLSWRLESWFLQLSSWDLGQCNDRSVNVVQNF